MHKYLDMLRHVIKNGNDRQDRTGTGTRSVFGYHLRFDLQQGFPAVTTKHLAWKTMVRELLWLLSGETNIRPLLINGVRIWTDWPFALYKKKTGENIDQTAFEARIVANEAFAREWGELGPVYGKQWRAWRDHDGSTIDQIAKVIDGIRNNSTSRRLIVNAWNVADLPYMALEPCHSFFQFYVANGKLSCHMYQRSADIILGVPFNIASYALLTMMISQVCDLEPGEFIHSFGDLHLYSNHFDQANQQLTREPLALPTMRINPERRDIDDFVFKDFTLEGYTHHPPIKAPVAV